MQDVEKLIVRLDDRMMDLDQPVKITRDGTTLFEGDRPADDRDACSRHWLGRGDPELMFAAEVEITSAKR